MSESYSFPILTAEDCVAFFGEVQNMSISEEDFKKPDPRKWQSYFGAIFEHMTGRQADLIMQSHQSLPLQDCMDYRELHDESLSLMTFALALQKVLHAAMVTDFTVRDLIDPKPKRLLRIVSGAINFIRFHSVRADVFDSKKEELERQREGYDFVLKENAELKKTLQARKDAGANQMIKQLQEENDVISARIQELHKQRESQQRVLAELKKELSEMNASNDQIKVNILSAQADAEKLSQRIVQSPERVRADQERAKNRIMALKSSVSERQTRLTELQRREAAYNAHQQHTEKSVRLLRDISNDSERLTELEKETSRQQDRRQDMRSESLNLTAKLDNQRQVLATRQDKLSKSDLQYHAKKAGMQEQITQLTQMKESLRDPEGSCASEKVRLTAEKDQVIANCQQQQQELEKSIETANNLYFEIIQQVDKINVGVANGISKYRGIMKK